MDRSVFIFLLFAALGIFPVYSTHSVQKCTIRYFKDRYHTANFLLPNPIRINNIQVCVDKCKMTKNCKSINFFNAQCSLHATGLRDSVRQDRYTVVKYGSTHATVHCSVSSITPPNWLGRELGYPSAPQPPAWVGRLFDDLNELPFIPTPPSWLDRIFRPGKYGGYEDSRPGKYGGGFGGGAGGGYGGPGGYGDGYDTHPDPDGYGDVGRPDYSYLPGKPGKPQRPTVDARCGVQSPGYSPSLLTPRIIGGGPAKAHSWPWTLKLQVDLGNGKAAGCGAALLRVKNNVPKSDILATAAHCVTREETHSTRPQAYHPSQVLVAAGKHDMDDFEESQVLVKAGQIRLFPGYSYTPENGALNDIALVKLEEPIDFTDQIRPACAPVQGEALPVNKRCYAVGWGRVDPILPHGSNILKQMSAPVHDAQTCREAWALHEQARYSDYHEREQICAGPMNGEATVCNGDSGGPLMCQMGDHWTLYGVASFVSSETCVEPGRPPMYTRVSNYMPWIDINMAQMTSVRG